MHNSYIIPRLVSVKLKMQEKGAKKYSAGALSMNIRHFFLPAYGLLQAEAFAAEDHDVAVVDQPVNECGSQSVVAKHGVPLAEFEVGGDDEALLFVSVFVKQKIGQPI
jgi:hypothetical protein